VFHQANQPEGILIFKDFFDERRFGKLRLREGLPLLRGRDERIL